MLLLASVQTAVVALQGWPHLLLLLPGRPCWGCCCVVLLQALHPPQRHPHPKTTAAHKAMQSTRTFHACWEGACMLTG